MNFLVLNLDNLINKEILENKWDVYKIYLKLKYRKI